MLPSILDKYLSELDGAETPDYIIMLLQGILMCLWYNYGVTLTKLEETQATGKLLNVIFEKVNIIKQDFEVKRFILGLSALIVNQEMPASIKDNYQSIIKALIFLSNKSIQIRGEEDTKAEMADVQQEAHGQIIEDEDDIGIEIESDDSEDDWRFEDEEDVDGDDQLYDSPLDKVDEVIFFHQQLQKLQETGG